MSGSGGTGTTAASTPDMPTKPLMGGIAQLSCEDHVAWTGGKPLADWTALEAQNPIYESPNQLWARYASASQKAYNYRKTGLSTKFKLGNDLKNFQQSVCEKMLDCGLDTIAYLVDPVDPTLVKNVITDHARYTVLSADALSVAQKAKYDEYDIQNDRAAKTMLLDSLDKDLKKDLLDSTKTSDTFHIYWLQLIKILQSVSVERFDRIKARIRKRHPWQFD